MNLGPAHPEPGGSGNILEQIFEGIGGIGAALAEGINGVVGMIADALFGPGSGPPAVRLSDGMTELNGRLDLLDDVPGYAGAYMGTNRRFGTGSSYKTIPFDRPYGPAKKAQLNTSNHRMVLDKGSWSIHITIVPRGSGSPLSFTAGHGIRVRVRRASGAVALDRPFDWGHISWEHATHFAMPIIVTEDGWSVEVGYRHNDVNWSLIGGTDRTLIWVERKNIDTTNSQIETGVPDGPDVN